MEAVEARRLLAGSALEAAAAEGASQPDILIRNRREAGYAGENVYNATGARQLRAQSTVLFPILHELRVENDGTQADRFLIRGPAAVGNGWRVSYYDSYQTGFAGGKDVTAAVAGRGWRTRWLQPGEAIEFRAEVAPTALTRGGTWSGLKVQAVSLTDRTRVDAVKARSTLDVQYAAEIRRRNFDDSGFYLASVENTGNVAGQMLLTGPAGGEGWTARYFDANWGGREITNAVTGEGWTTPTLQPGQAQPFRVEIQRTGSQRRSVTVTATPLGDRTQQDKAEFRTEKRPAGPGVFPIAVWSQPTRNFDRWKARGINTLMNYEGMSGAVSMDEWTAAANARGLYMIRKPRADAARDVNERGLLAWMHGDEPDVHRRFNQMRAEYERLKAIDPDRPIITNFSGGMVLRWNDAAPTRHEYESVLGTMDWVSQSVYPVTGWNRPERLGTAGRALDRLEVWSKGRPQLAIIESGDQNLPWVPASVRGVTRGEFRAQLWDAIIRGAQGIVYFPFAFSPNFTYDNTPPEIEAEMKVQHARIAPLGDALLSSVDPPNLGAEVGGTLEATWREHEGKKYFIVLNMSDQTVSDQRIRLHGVGRTGAANVQGEGRSERIRGGVITDDFGPYEVHVYVVEGTGTQMAAAREVEALRVVRSAGVFSEKRVLFEGEKRG